MFVFRPRRPLARCVTAALAGACLVGGGALATVVPASAESYRVVNSVKRTYDAAGGADVLGLPTGNESKLVIDEHRTWAQDFTNGTVVWDSEAKEGKALVDGERIRIDADSNFRVVAGVTGVYRAGDLDDIDPLDKRIVVELGITRSVTFNSGDDPDIPGVDNYYFRIKTGSSMDDTYRDFVREESDREQFGRGFNAIAENRGATLVHCTAGKDRTGWSMFVLQRINGVSLAAAEADYMLTAKYSGRDVDLDWLRASLAEMKAAYGSYDAYLLAAGVTEDNLAALKTLH